MFSVKCTNLNWFTGPISTKRLLHAQSVGKAHVHREREANTLCPPWALRGYSARGHAIAKEKLWGNAITRRGSSVETPRSPSGRFDIFTCKILNKIIQFFWNFLAILRWFQEFYKAVFTLWERDLVWKGLNFSYDCLYLWKIIWENKWNSFRWCYFTCH